MSIQLYLLILNQLHPTNVQVCTTYVQICPTNVQICPANVQICLVVSSWGMVPLLVGIASHLGCGRLRQIKVRKV